jgi:purine-binding chemotaxis protein CheW
MTANYGLGGAARELRRAFDEAFARAAGAGAPPSEDFLAIRLRADPHLLRQREIARLLRLRDVTRYPSPVPAWLGLAGLAGAVVPVYDLAVLAGYPPADTPSWMVLCAGAPVALAFDAFEGHFRVAAGAGEALARADVVPMANGPCPVVPIASLLETLRAIARPAASTQEP